MAWTGKLDLMALERKTTARALVEEAAARSRTVNGVAKELGVTTLTLRRWMDKHGVRLTRRSHIVLVDDRGL